MTDEWANVKFSPLLEGLSVGSLLRHRGGEVAIYLGVKPGFHEDALHAVRYRVYCIWIDGRHCWIAGSTTQTFDLLQEMPDE